MKCTEDQEEGKGLWPVNQTDFLRSKRTFTMLLVEVITVKL